jgi:hypothetical protein
VTLLDKIRNNRHQIGLTVFAALGTYLTVINRSKDGGSVRLAWNIGEFMRRRVLQLRLKFLRHLAVPIAVILFATSGAVAQSGDNHAQDQGKQGAATPDVTKENERKTAEFAEAAQAINGPAGNPECVWLGRRVVRLMFVDDLDTAFRHLDLYDRFGCPGGHIQAAFRCLTRFGAQIDDKVQKSGLNDRIHACWINPSAQPQAAATAAATPPTPAAATSGSAAAPQPAASPAPAAPAAPPPAAK